MNLNYRKYVNILANCYFNNKLNAGNTMKKYNGLSLVIFLFTALLIITSCKKDDSPTASSSKSIDLVGTWVLTKAIVPAYNNAELTPEALGQSVTFEIKSDGSFTATVDSSGTTDVQTGTWSVDNGVVTMTGSDNSVVTMPYSLSDDKKTLTVETIYNIVQFGEVNVKLVLTKQ